MWPGCLRFGSAGDGNKGAGMSRPVLREHHGAEYRERGFKDVLCRL